MSKEMHASLKTAVKGTTLIVAGMVGGHLLWFIIKILIVRNITVDELGLYSLTITIATVLSTLAALGTHMGTPRNISTFLGKNRPEDAKSLARASLHVNFISSMTAGVFLFLLSGLLARHVFYKPEIAMLLRIISVSIPLFSMSTVIGAILRGYGFVGHKVYYTDIGYPLYFLCILALLLLKGLTLHNVIYAFTLASAFMFISIASYEFKKVRIPPLPLTKGLHYKDLLTFSLPLMVAGISGLILNWTDTLMLGRYTPTESVGIYNISISLAKLMLFIFGAMGFVFMPMATEMHAKGQKTELKRTYQVLTKWVFAGTFPLFFVLFFFPEMTIEFLFGKDLVAASMPLRILSLGFLFHVFLGTNGMMLTALGLTKTVMKISVFSAVLNILLNYVLIKRVGLDVLGATTATLVSYVMMNVLISTTLYRASGIHPFTFKYIKPVIGASVTGILIYIIVKKVFFAWWMMPVYLLLFIGGYSISLLMSGSIERENMLFIEGTERRIGIELKWLRKLINRFTPAERS